MGELPCARRLVAAGLVAALTFGAAFASAEKLYSYVDEQGTVVMTNKWETIPERYRSRVTVTDGQDPAGTPEAPKDTTGAAAGTGILSILPGALTDRAGQPAPGPSAADPAAITPSDASLLDLSGEAGTVLLWSGALGVVMLSTMLVTRNSAVKLVMRWLLVLLVLGTSVKLYMTQLDARSGVMNKVKGAAQALEQVEQKKVQQIQQLDSDTRAGQ